MSVSKLIQSLVSFNDARQLEYGYYHQVVKYEILLTEDDEGKISYKILHLQNGESKKKEGIKMPVPQNRGTSGNIFKGFLAASSSYILGICDKPQSKLNESKLNQRFTTYWQKTLSVCNSIPDCKELKAIIKFYEAFNQKLRNIKDYDGLMVFSYNEKGKYIHDLNVVKEYYIKTFLPSEELNDGTAEADAFGNKGPVCRKHFQINFAGQKASFVSFNEPAYSSCGKSQGENFPVELEYCLKYTNALNYLLNNNSYRLADNKALVIWTDTEFKDDLINSLLSKTFDLSSLREDVNDDNYLQFNYFVIEMAGCGYRPFISQFGSDGKKSIIENILNFKKYFSLFDLGSFSLLDVLNALYFLNKDSKVLTDKDVAQIEENIIFNCLFGKNFKINTLSKLNQLIAKSIKLSNKSLKEDRNLRNLKLLSSLTKVIIKIEDNMEENIGFLLGEFLAKADWVQKVYYRESGRYVFSALSEKFYDKIINDTPRAIEELGREINKFKTNDSVLKVFSNSTTKILELAAKAEGKIPNKLSENDKALFTLSFLNNKSYKKDDEQEAANI